ncbi:MAG: 50S ribosomal protein L25 [Dehalococcoidia bacterium]|nr:50S ribosomal protein L25 [Dehalococcoidia bacterium]
MVTNERPSITLSVRQVVGKKVKTLRREGVVPVHYYGSGIESLSLQAAGVTLRKVVTEAGANIPVEVVVEGSAESDICFVREVQWHPVNGTLLHVDFMHVDITERVTAEVPVVLTGQSDAVRELGGVIIQPFQTLPVDALPLNMPESIIVDITPLEMFGDAIRVGDLEVEEGIEILRDDDDLLVTVQEPRIEEEPVAEEEELEGEELAEGEEAPEGEEAETQESDEG